MSELIYYYTSNFVLKEWIKNEKIWATRSTTSNDNTDTLFMIPYLEKLSKSKGLNGLNKTIDVLKLSKNLSKRLFREIHDRYIEEHDFDDYRKIIDNCCENYNGLKNVRYNPSEEMKSNLAKCNIYPLKNGEIPMYGADKQELIFSEILKSLVNNSEIENYLEGDYKIDPKLCYSISSLLYPFVISFSKKGDDRFLWDSYTENKGVCLVFDREELNEYWQKSIKEEFDTFDYFRDVLYKEEEQKSFIDNFFI